MLCGANISSRSLTCLFVFLIVSFKEQKFLILMKSKASTFSFMDPVFYVLRNLCLPKGPKVSLIFSSGNIIIFSLTHRSMISFELIFESGVRYKPG